MDLNSLKNIKNAIPNRDNFKQKGNNYNSPIIPNNISGSTIERTGSSCKN